MIIKDEFGTEIDTESEMYKTYLRDLEMDRLYPNMPEPQIGFYTLGEALEMRRWRKENDVPQDDDAAPDAPTDATP